MKDLYLLNLLETSFAFFFFQFSSWLQTKGIFGKTVVDFSVCHVVAFSH